MRMTPACAIISTLVADRIASADNILIFLARVQAQMRGASLLTAAMCIYIPAPRQFTVVPFVLSLGNKARSLSVDAGCTPMH